jgi:hypothetical protein
MCHKFDKNIFRNEVAIHIEKTGLKDADLIPMISLQN